MCAGSTHSAHKQRLTMHQCSGCQQGPAPISNPDLASPAASISIWGVKSGPISSLDFYDSDF